MVEMPSAPRTEQRWTSYPIINGARRPMTRNFSTNGVQTCDYLGREGCSEGASYRVGCRRVASRNLGVKLRGGALDGDVDACPECMEGLREGGVRERDVDGRTKAACMASPATRRTDASGRVIVPHFLCWRKAKRIACENSHPKDGNFFIS